MKRKHGLKGNVAAWQNQWTDMQNKLKNSPVKTIKPPGSNLVIPY